VALRITRVRLGRAEAFDVLRGFLFGGMFGTLRVPRGIEPAHVSEFLAAHLELDSEPSAYERALEAIRFYERPDVALHMARVFAAPLESVEDLSRAAYAVQAAGDLGAGELLANAAALTGTLAAHREALELVPLLLETYVALAPMGSLDALAQRLDREVAAAKQHVNRDEASMLRHDKLAAYQRNHLPRAAATMDAKARLLGLPAEERVKPLIRVYLGRSPISDAYTETWAGRQLRFLVAGEHADPVLEAFREVVGRFTEAMLEDPAKVFLFQRAAQALMYLGGAPTEDQLRLYTALEGGGMSFLWDDP
jgi:hypothetical protein